MEDLSQRKPPQLAIKAEDTTPAGENGALVWSTHEGRLLTYNENAGRWGVSSMLPALSTIRVPFTTYFSFVDIVNTVSNNVSSNLQYFFPFYLPSQQTITTLGYEVTSAASSGYAQVGIYNTLRSGVSVRPNQLLIGTGNMNITSTGIKTASVTPTTLYSGVIYWASFLATANVGLRSGYTISRLVVGLILAPVVLVHVGNTSGNLYVTVSSNPINSGISIAPILVYQ